jgi:hypothetical protein
MLTPIFAKANQQICKLKWGIYRQHCRLVRLLFSYMEGKWLKEVNSWNSMMNSKRVYLSFHVPATSFAAVDMTRRGIVLKFKCRKHTVCTQLRQGRRLRLHQHFTPERHSLTFSNELTTAHRCFIHISNCSATHLKFIYHFCAESWQVNTVCAA